MHKMVAELCTFCLPNTGESQDQPITLVTYKTHNDAAYISLDSNGELKRYLLQM